MFAGKNTTEDEAINVLKHAFITDAFAPHLQILWLSVSVNRITDVGAKDIKVRIFLLSNL